MVEPISAEDVRAAKLDRCPWDGRVHEELRLAVAVQVLRNLRDAYQVPSTAQALIDATLEVIGA